MIRFIITLLLLSQITLIKGNAQEVIPSLEFTSVNYDNQNFRVALKEYLRLFYFDRDGAYPGIEAKIASCFSKLNDPENAIKYYQLFLGNSDEYSKEKEDVFYSLVQELIADQSYKIALSELFQCHPKIISANSDRYYFHLGMTYLFDHNVLDADHAFQKLSYIAEIEQDSYESILNKIQKTINRKHRRAKIWSAIIPGMGQAINDDVRDGLNSFTINGSLVIIFIQVAKSLTVADAALTVVPWFFRFYTGGIKNAGQASKTFQSKKLKEHSGTLIHLLAEANKT